MGYTQGYIAGKAGKSICSYYPLHGPLGKSRRRALPRPRPRHRRYHRHRQKNVKREAICIDAGRSEKQELKFVERWAPPLLAAIVAFSPLFYPPVSSGQMLDERRGATLFNRACIGCHVGGGNIIQPGATLFLKDLQRNGVETEDEIYRITYFGKGRMPGFGEKCTPRGQCTFGARLQEDEIKLLAEFVKSQADQGWPTIENYGD